MNAAHLTQLRQSPPSRRIWLFGAGADSALHQDMAACGAQVLIQDLEDFTPPALRPHARELAASLYPMWQASGALSCVRINSLAGEGMTDLKAVMLARPDIVAYPKAEHGDDMRALDAAITQLEKECDVAPGSIEILPVCETALGVLNVRELAASSPRIRAALLGAEDLATDLNAERGADAIELDHARRHFLLQCRAARIEPIDAPYTFGDAEGAAREARYARRLGYRCKSLVRTDHVAMVLQALTPSAEELAFAQQVVQTFEAARARGEDRVLVGNQWIEVPTYLNAKRLLAS